MNLSAGHTRRCAASLRLLVALLTAAVALAPVIQKGRLGGSSGEVQLRYAAVSVWEDGKIARITNYGDIDEGRAAAERLARERG